MSRLAAVLWAAALGTCTVIAHAAPAIVSASPQGEVAQVRQVTVKFSEAVVALGDLRLPTPSPSVPGSGARGRGPLDRRSRLAIRLPRVVAARALHGEVRPEWRPASRRRRPGGAAVRAEGVRLFHRRPGDRVDATVGRRANRGGPAFPAHAERAGGRGHRGGERLVRSRRHRRAPAGGAPRRRPARAAVEGATHPAARAAAPARPLRARSPPTPRCASSGARALPRRATRRCARRSSNASGYKVRKAFSAEFSCERERATAACLPVRPMVLRFSAPVARKLAEQVELAPATASR